MAAGKEKGFARKVASIAAGAVMLAGSVFAAGGCAVLQRKETAAPKDPMVTQKLKVDDLTYQIEAKEIPIVQTLRRDSIYLSFATKYSPQDKQQIAGFVADIIGNLIALQSSALHAKGDVESIGRNSFGIQDYTTIQQRVLENGDFLGQALSSAAGYLPMMGPVGALMMPLENNLGANEKYKEAESNSISGSANTLRGESIPELEAQNYLIVVYVPEAAALAYMLRKDINSTNVKVILPTNRPLTTDKKYASPQGGLVVKRPSVPFQVNLPASEIAAAGDLVNVVNLMAQEVVKAGDAEASIGLTNLGQSRARKRLQQYSTVKGTFF